MHRLIVIILAAVDAAIAAAVGIAATLAPLTLLWVLGMGGTADWGTLWPASAAVWQLGNLVPLHITLPGDYLAGSGIDPSAASFVLSLAPLAFASFTAIFAARSGVRASRAESWATGVITGSVVFAALTSLIALTSATSLAEVEQWQAILLPALVYAVPILIGAVVTEWREAGSGFIARVRDRVEGIQALNGASPQTPGSLTRAHGWGEVPGLVVRGTAVVLTGLIGLGAVAFAVALLLRGGEVIALFEAAHVDALGATVVTLAQVAYLPTLIVWAIAFVAGPGFAVGVDTAVSPAGTQLGVIPGVPVLGVLPESTTTWLLLLALLPVAVGGLAGWIARSRLVSSGAAEGADSRGRLAVAGAESRGRPVDADAPPATARDSTLAALLASDSTGLTSVELLGDEPASREDHSNKAPTDPIGARFVIALGIAVLSGAGAALLALLASGSIGPGRLAEVGPQPGPVALAVGAEVLLGAGILLLSPRRRTKPAPVVESEPDAATPAPDSATSWPQPEVREEVDDPESAEPPAPTKSWAAPDPAPKREPEPDPDSTPTADLGPRRPTPLPPID